MYNNFILHLYIVYELYKLPHHRSTTFALKNCLFGTVQLVRNAIKRKLIYNCWRKAFEAGGLWRFGNYIAGNVVVFGTDDSSSSLINEKRTF